MNQPTVQVRALTPDLLPDFLQFFDGTAFSDNPKWSSCYCQCFYEDHRVVKWGERTATENRARACERIGGGLMQGYLAYLDGSPVGWCNAAGTTAGRADGYGTAAAAAAGHDATDAAARDVGHVQARRPNTA